MDYLNLDELRFDIPFPPVEACLHEMAQLGEIQSGTQEVGSKKEKPHNFSLGSLELLKSHGVKSIEQHEST